MAGARQPSGWSKADLSRHLIGRGIEIGPGHNPWPLPFPGATVRYVDRIDPQQGPEVYPELGDATFVEPDVYSDVDVDGLVKLADASEDFVIASHVLEHLANPLGLFDEIHRVLRPGGTALVLLPDRRRTFDRDRAPTPLAHVVAEYEAGVTVVDDEHIEEFLRYTSRYIPHQRELADRARLDGIWDEVIEEHRTRSIHAHVWHEAEFLEVILYAIRELGHRWELVEAVVANPDGDEAEAGITFGYVLRRSETELDGAVLAERCERVWWAWYGRYHASNRITADYVRVPLRRLGRRVRRRLPPRLQGLT